MSTPIEEELKIVRAERDRATAFANRIERGEVRFAQQCAEQLERISNLPLGKSVAESLADAVERVLKERDELKARAINGVA